MSLESECRKIWTDGEYEPQEEIPHGTPVQDAINLFAYEKMYEVNERHVVHIRTGWGSVESYEVKVVLEPAVQMKQI